MKISTRTFLLLISFSVVLLSSCTTKLPEGYSSFPDENVHIFADSQLIVNQKNSFRFNLKVEKMDLSGIAIVKTDGSTVRGSVINEFGIKAFDFISTPDNCKLLNVISFMDKWYITKAISDDFQFLWQTKNQNAKKCRFTQNDSELKIEKIKCKKIDKQLIVNDNSFTLINFKRKITYTFKEIVK